MKIPAAPSRNRLISSILLAIVFFGFSPLAADQPAANPNAWEYLTSSDGFSIHKRRVPNSDFVEFKGYGIIKAPLIKIMATLDTVETHCEWMSRCLDAIEIERFSDQDRVVYYASQSPWPLKPRDFILRVRVNVDEKKKRVHISSHETTHGNYPEREDRVRIQNIKVRWSFRPAANPNHTFIEFRSHANPGGWVPSWAMNFYGRYVALNTMKGLENKVIEAGSKNVAFLERYKKYSAWSNK